MSTFGIAREGGRVVEGDRFVGADAVCLVELKTLHARDHARARYLRRVHGNPTDGARSAGDQHRLARLQPACDGDQLASRDAHQRKRGRLDQVHRLRHLGEERRFVGDQFGVRVVRPRADTVADLEVGDTVARGDHRSRHVQADDRRKVQLPPVLQVAVALEHVFRVDADAGHLDEDVARARLGIRHILIFHHFRTAVRAHYRCLHLSRLVGVAKHLVTMLSSLQLRTPKCPWYPCYHGTVFELRP